jgi:DNA-binding HxlR family transcriptional regulator
MKFAGDGHENNICQGRKQRCRKDRQPGERRALLGCADADAEAAARLAANPGSVNLPLPAAENTREDAMGNAMPGEFDIDEIDDVIHGRLRLGVMAFLTGNGPADFNTLKARLQASDGNLSVQLRKLEGAGYVAIAKSFSGRKPLTQVSLTGKGRTAFAAYLGVIEKLLPG